MTLGGVFAGLLLLSGCGGLAAQQAALPTLYVIPTLTPSITPSLTLFMSPTVTPSQTPEASQTPEGPTATPVVRPTSTPSGGGVTPSATSSSGLNITYFTPTPTTVSPGGSVTLAWASTGATQATVFRVNSDGSFGQSWDVDMTGTLTVSASASSGTEDFVLRIGDGVNVKEAEASITISGTCAQDWFFSQSLPSACPTAEISTLAAEQEFEDGWIYWMSTTGKVYVLYEDGFDPEWDIYNDTWTSGEPETDSSLTPPSSNLQQPERGIGKVWRTNSEVKDRLGWALDDELGYTAQFQQESGSSPGFVYFTDPGDILVRLESRGDTWRFGETIP